MKEQDELWPPRLADRFFAWYCTNELAESIQGDLHERYEDYRTTFSKRKSDVKYWMDVFRFMSRHTLTRKSNKKDYLLSTVMLKNYTLVALRTIRKNKIFTGINVVGLAISMAVCLLIIALVDDQMSYDDFHSERDHIYRITHKRINYGADLPMATIPLPLVDRMQNDYAALRYAVPFASGFSGEVMDDGKAIGLSGLFTEPSLFQLFDFQLEEGDPKTALEKPYSVVLKKEIAEKFFKDKNAMGQVLAVDGLGQFTVTGILKEIPGKTHIHFEAFASFSSLSGLEKQGKLSKRLEEWSNTSSGWLYFSVANGQSLAGLNAFLDQLEKENYGEESEYLVDFQIQKMTDITPGPLMGNQIGQAMPNFFIYGLYVLAILIMVCAILNYANLSTARALTRFKEVGVRKVMGSSRAQVIFQFIVEAVLVSLISLVLSIAILTLLIPAFESLNISSLLGWRLQPDFDVYLKFFFFSLGTGLLIGFFPSLYMSSVKALSALRGIDVPRMSKIGLRKSLIVVQLVISIVLIISSTLVYRQIDFMANKDYGFQRNNILNIDLQGQDYEQLYAELVKLPFVKEVSGVNNIPNTGRHLDVDIRRFQTDENESYESFSVDENYIRNLELELIAGRNFTPDQVEEREIILNQQAVQALGFASPEEAIGENVLLKDSLSVNIVGVVKDYNFMILFKEIEPMLLRYKKNDFTWAQVKISGASLLNEVEALEETWNAFDPNHDFESQFFDEQMKDFYSTFFDVVYIVGLIAILSIVIASMGLLGIATYSIRMRLKEVGIRKILGAESKDLMLLLSKSFFTLIVISTVIGGTLAFVGNKAWLDLFAYRVSFGLDILGIAFLFISVVGGLTIVTQAWRALQTNPSEILRDE